MEPQEFSQAGSTLPPPAGVCGRCTAPARREPRAGPAEEVDPPQPTSAHATQQSPTRARASGHRAPALVDVRHEVAPAERRCGGTVVGMKHRLVVGFVVGIVVVVALCALGASLAAVMSSTSPFVATPAMRAAARFSCHSAALHTRVLSGTPMTVAQVRAWPPRTHPIKGHGFSHPDAFPTLPGTQVVAWCWTHGLRASDPQVAYVVAPGYKPLKIAVRYPQVLGSTSGGSQSAHDGVTSDRVAAITCAGHQFVRSSVTHRMCRTVR